MSNNSNWSTCGRICGSAMRLRCASKKCEGVGPSENLASSCCTEWGRWNFWKVKRLRLDNDLCIASLWLHNRAQKRLNHGIPNKMSRRVFFQRKPCECFDRQLYRIERNQKPITRNASRLYSWSRVWYYHFLFVYFTFQKLSYINQILVSKKRLINTWNRTNNFFFDTNYQLFPKHNFLFYNSDEKLKHLKLLLDSPVIKPVRHTQKVISTPSFDSTITVTFVLVSYTQHHYNVLRRPYRQHQWRLFDHDMVNLVPPHPEKSVTTPAQTNNKSSPSSRQISPLNENTSVSVTSGSGVRIKRWRFFYELLWLCPTLEFDKVVGIRRTDGTTNSRITVWVFIGHIPVGGIEKSNFNKNIRKAPNKIQKFLRIYKKIGPAVENEK